MANNPYVNKVEYGGSTIIDISDTTAVPADVAQGKYFYGADGEKKTGTATGGTAAIGIEDTLDAGGGTIRTITAVDLSNDTVAANRLLQGYTAHDSTGAAITGTYTPPASVNVQTGKTYTVSTGGNQTISSDSGYDAMDEIALSVPTTTAATPTLSLVSSAGSSYIEGVSNQTTGWVTQAQKRGTYSLTRIAGQTITPTTSEQTIINNGAVVHAYNGAVKVGKIPSEYIVPSGTLSITANGTGIDVKNYASVDVSVSGGGGTSKNAQTAQSTTRATSTSYTECISLTCTKAGTYDVYWSTFRSSTSGTWGSQLYLNDTAYGSAQTGSWSNHIQNIHLSNVTIAANAEVAVRVRSRGSNYYGYVGTLTIIEA